MASKLLKNILPVLLVVPVLVIVCPVVIIMSTPMYLSRIVVKYLAKFKPALGEIMNSASAFVWSMDDIHGRPRSNIVAVLKISGKLSTEQFQDITVKSALSIRNADGSFKFKELKQYPVSFLGFPFYKWDRKFDVKNHVKSYTKKLANDEDFSKYLSSLNYLPWKKERSLWEIILLPNCATIEENSSVFAFRCHHSLADGYSLANLFIKQLGGDKSVAVPAPTSVKISIWKKVAQWTCLPFFIIYDLIKVMMDATDVNAFRKKDRKLMSGITNSVVCDKIPVTLIKEIMAAHSVCFQAVLCAAIAGALRKYMFIKQLEIPTEVHGLSPAPYPGHPVTLGNHYSLQAAKFHMGIKDPTERLKKSDKSHKNYRRSTLPIVNFYSQKFMGTFFISMQKILALNFSRATMIFSNFPISMNICTFQGMPITEIIGTFGVMDKSGMSISCFSYNKNMQIAVITDETIFPSSEDTKSLARLIIAEFFILRKVKND